MGQLSGLKSGSTLGPFEGYFYQVSGLDGQGKCLFEHGNWGEVEWGFLCPCLLPRSPPNARAPFLSRNSSESWTSGCLTK
jgi:hypothetical protein